MKNNIDYPASLVWACAAAADRINGGYRKTSEWNIVEDEMVESPGNRARVMRWLGAWRKDHLSLTEVTDQDRADGESAREFWQSQMLLLLDDGANEYLRACASAAHLDTVTSQHQIGLITSAITAAKREARKQELLQKKQQLNSQYVCAVGSKVCFDTEFEIIDSRYIDRVGASAVECVVEGNLYMWWSKTHLEPGVYCELQGRVADRARDFHTGQPVTRLNYVKVRK